MPNLRDSNNNKLYGITHSLSGEPIISEPHVIKVSIGLSKGPAIHVYIDLDKKWVIQTGYGKNAKRQRVDTKPEAKRLYRELKKTAQERKYPERLPYFTFSRIAASGDYEPDFDVIETHGPIPTEIKIAFIWDDPFDTSYQLWTAAEMKCKGDGLNAVRVNSMAQTAEEKKLAEEASDAGEKYFPIENRCWVHNCPYSKATDKKPAACRPIGSLRFQLKNSPRLGGTAFFNTTGYKSIRQIFSSIEIFKRVAGEKGHITGIPLTMVLRPYRVVFNGKPGTQYGVNLEFRDSDAVAMKRAFFEHSTRYQMAGTEPLKQLPAAEEPDTSPATLDADFDACAEEPELQEHEPESDYTEVPEVEPEDPLPGEAGEFYSLCRKRGMTDTDILTKLGEEGFENLREVPPEKIPALVKWAEEWQPRQGALI